MDKFRIEVIAATPNPQQVVWAAMHQDYSEDFVWDSRDRAPDETKAGELIVKHLLAGNRGHYGPLEHPQITFNVGYFPHSMMQQVRTHRVGMCLSGDTEIYSKTASGKVQKTKIKDLYLRWSEARIHQESPKDAKYSIKRLKGLKLYNLNEDTLEFQETNIANIYANGEKQVYRLTTVNGLTIKASADHLFFTDTGWQKIKNLKPGERVTTRHLICQKNIPTESNFTQEELNSEVEKKLSIAGGERRNIHVDVLTLFKGEKPSAEYVARHLDRNAWNNRVSNLVWDTEIENKIDPKLTTGFNTCKAKFVEILEIEYLGFEQTYDIEVTSQYHNFLANDLVVHNSFDVQSFRYTGQRVIDVIAGKREIEDVFYLRPVGNYTNRQGKHYFYSKAQRQQDLEWCLEACKLYQQRIEEGLSEEHARSLIPFDARQHFVMSCNLRSLMHLLDLRWKKDAQLEAQKFCELLYTHFENWSPTVAQWYQENRAKKAKLSP